MVKQNQQNMVVLENISSSDDDIDFLKLLKKIFRKKNILISFSSLGLISGIIYAIRNPPIWQGEFQIVLESKQETPDKYTQLLSNQLLNIRNNALNNNLKTEVKILESPSIMQPVFNYVKKEYAKKRPEENNNFSYKSWFKNSLKIQLVPETSVLEIKYKDKEKSIVLPVLEKISLEYQKYSARDKQKSISQGIDYLENQIKIVGEEASKAILDLQNFSIKYSLGKENGVPLISENSASSSIENFSLNNQSINREATQIARLRNLEAQLIEFSAVLTPESKIIKSLNEKINAYKKSFKRPNDTLLEFREIQRRAALKEKLLVKLEAELAALKLDKAKQTNPWELISIPVVSENSVNTSKKLIILIGFAVGTVLGSFIALLKDFVSGILFDQDDFVKILKYPILKTLDIKRKEEWKNSIDIVCQDLLNSDTNDITFINLSKNQTDPKIELIFNQFKENLESYKKKVSLIDNILNVKKDSICILFCCSGSISKYELNQFKEDLIIMKKNVKGLIYIG